MHTPVSQLQQRSKGRLSRHSVVAAAKGGGSSNGDVWKQLSSMADKYITNTTGQQQRQGADDGAAAVVGSSCRIVKSEDYCAPFVNACM
jgi:hypothetical protein